MHDQHFHLDPEHRDAGKGSNQNGSMHHRHFHGNVELLRAPQRLALLEIDRTIDSCLEGIRASTVLDVGVGSGVFAEVFVARGLAVTGVDINPAMVEIAQRDVPAGHFQVAAAEALPFADNAFDLVFSSHVLHEADDAHRMLTEMKRVARSRVAIMEWPYQQEEPGPPLSMRIEPGKLVQLIEEAGFHHYEQIALTHMTFFRLAP